MNEHVTSLDLLISEHKRKNSQLSEEIKGHNELSPLERKLLDRENILVKSIEQDVSYLKLFVQGMILTSASTVSASSQESNSSDRVDSGLGTLSPINHLQFQVHHYCHQVAVQKLTKPLQFH